MRVGSLLPLIELPTAPDGSQTALRSGDRRATVLVRVHAADCSGCRRYLAALGTSGIDLGWWEGRVIVVVPGPLAEASMLRSAVAAWFTVLSDVDDRALALDDAGVVIADRYGQVYHVGIAGAAHDFPAPEELEEWLKFLATQCPE